MGNCTKYCALENAFNLPNAGHQNLPANVMVYHFIKQNHHCSPALTKRDLTTQPLKFHELAA